VVLGAAYVWGSGAVFWVLASTGLASIVAVLMIPKTSIDPDLARGLEAGTYGLRPSSFVSLVRDPHLIVFAGCGVLFHLANGAMLGLVGQKLARLVPGQGIALTAACAIAAQIVMVPTAILAGSMADRWGRKPLFAAAFLALTLRGALYTVSEYPAWLISVQLLDGVGAGLTGALFPVIVSDLTRSSGHFAAAQAGVGTIHGLGGILSAALGGAIVAAAGYNPAFLAMAAIAALGGLLFCWLMPETRPGQSLRSRRSETES
jgi:MFS family permease